MRVPSVRRNFVYTTFYQILTVVAPFVTAPYLSRVLGAEALGIQSYTSSVSSLFVMVAALGTATYGSRRISQSRDNVREYSLLFWSIELTTVITGSACVVMWLALSLISVAYRTYYLILTSCLVSSILDISWLFTGLEQFGRIVARNGMFKVVGIVLTFALVRGPGDLALYMAILNGSVMAANLSMWLCLPKLVLGPMGVGDLHIGEHFRETVGYFIPTAASSVYLYLDRVLLEQLTHNIAENGYYAQADKVVGVCKSVVFSAVNSVVGVRVSYLFAEGRYDEIRARIGFSLNYILFTAVGCVFGVITVAGRFVPLFFGPGYERVALLLSLYIVIVVPVGISTCVNSHYYVPVGKRRECTRYILVGAVTNVVLNLLFIPSYQAVGAVIASIAAETVIAVLMVRNSGDFLTLGGIVSAGWRKVASGALMYALVFPLGKLVRLPDVPLMLLQVAIGVLSYVILLVLMRDTWTKGLIGGALGKIRRVVGERLREGGEHDW